MNDHILQSAWRLHQAGNFAEAARLYKEVLRASPGHLGALQMLGYLHFQRGEFADAERVMEKAIRIDPTSVDAFYNRGCALQALDRFRDALSCFDRALALKPNHAPAMLNRGNVLSRLTRFEDALASYDLALALVPGSPEALMNRGNALFELGRYTEALASYDGALREQPRHALLWNNRGNALSELDRHQEALANFSKALELDPAYTDALANRGNALAQLGREDEALLAWNKALALDSTNIEALYGLCCVMRNRKRAAEALAAFDAILAIDLSHAGAASERAIVLIELKRYEDALAALDKGLQRAPDSVEALSNRASVLARLKRYEEALANADRAVSLDSGYAAAWHNRGSALAGLKRYQEALVCYDKALSLAPDNALTWNNHGSTLLSLKRYEAAIASFDTGLRLNPADADALAERAYALANVKRFSEALADCDRALLLDPSHTPATRVAIHCRFHTCDWEHLAESRRKITAGLEAGLRIVHPLDHRGMCDSEGENLIAARLWANEEYPPAAEQSWRGERYRHDNIRIAYLSSDFRAHAVAFLIAGCLERHDKQRFETTAISFSPDDKSETRARIETAFDRFIDVQTMSDAAVAQTMRELEIDIAIDLNGYTGASRTGILAFRPAPLQVNYLGYPGTMGAPFMDYIIADRAVIPPEHQIHYSEKLVYLPDSYQANDRKRRVGETPTRAQAGLPESGFVFACFNNTHKIGPEMFGIWMRVLHEVGGSVLWLLEDNAVAASHLKREAEARGIAANRLVFAPRKLPHEHLARQRLADLFLDTAPYNAHTTASDALWMELPLVTCPGNTFAGRVAASLLHAIGLPELVTDSLSGYQALALRLAREPDALRAIKAKLARNRDSFPLFDTKRFTRNLEAAYTRMWELHQAGTPPQNFAVTDAVRVSS
jgi:predicted O-linked N-acetylglucosamine transferase (SPINDLY family)